MNGRVDGGCGKKRRDPCRKYIAVCFLPLFFKVRDARICYTRFIVYIYVYAHVGDVPA